jgi:ABC-type branched-subunit amino acid transport system substrate-binding protein
MNPKKLKTVFCSVGFLLLIGEVLAQQDAHTPLTEQEKRGKLIYLRGSSPSGKEISAFLGDAATEFPATTMLCSGCHGFDGRGRPEGGVVPSNITSEALTKSYGVTHSSGRKHPPYTDRALELAITKGIDPAGNKLADTMPRYWMSPEDLADLVAYLKRLGKDHDPGLTESSIRIGTVVAGEGPLVEMGQSVKAALEAYFEEINSHGGIYNRKIELRVAQSKSDPKIARSTIEQFIENEQVFAMAGAFIAGADKELAALIEEKEVVMVGPSTLYPETGFPMHRHIFYLFSGLREQAGVLVNFIAEKLQKQNPRFVIVSPDAGGPAGVPEAIEEQARKRGYKSITRISYSRRQLDAGALAKTLSDAGPDAIFFLGSAAEQAALLAAAGKLKWAPYVLMPGSLVGREILAAPDSFKDKLFLSFPLLPSDQTAEGVAEFLALARKHNLPTRHLATQLSAFCAAKILVEGLKLSGKELSREKLITTLEGLYDFETGLSPRISYGPNRRIGALGAYVVAVDPITRQFVPASNWITPD